MQPPTLSESLQEIEDAKKKGLITPQEAHTQREAVLNGRLVQQQHHTGVRQTIVESWPMLLQETRNKFCCCTPRMWSKLYHAYVIMFALVAVVMSSLQLADFNGDVWIHCTGPDAYLLNETHPYFCEDWYNKSESHRHHNDDNNSSKYFCGNEKFQFRFGSVAYRNKYTSDNMTWGEIINAGSNQIFSEAIGQFEGDDELWIKSDHDARRAKIVSAIAIPLSVFGLILTLTATCFTFCRRPVIERGWRWTLIALVCLVSFAFGVTSLVLNTKLEAFDGPWDAKDDNGKIIQNFKVSPWTPYYLDAYGCDATVGSVTMGFPVVSFTCSMIVIIAALLRRCCIGKSYNLDVASGLKNKLSVTSVLPAYEDGPVTAYPPAYGTQSVA